MTCCLLVDETTAETDAEAFECESCQVAQQLSGLDPINTLVWRLYRQVICRLSADLSAGGMVLARLTHELTDDDFADVWRRLVKLYDILDPPPKGPNG